MRPCRIGMRSGRRLSACSCRMAIGSRRSGAGSHAACQARGTFWRSALPASSRSGRCTGPDVAICRLAILVARCIVSAVTMATSPELSRRTLGDFSGLAGFSGLAALALTLLSALSLVVVPAVDLFALTDALVPSQPDREANLPLGMRSVPGSQGYRPRMARLRHHEATDHVITLADGRRLGYAAFGDPDGEVIVNCHGGLVSRNDVAPNATMRGSSACA